MEIIPTEKKYLVPIIIFLLLDCIFFAESLITALLIGQFLLFMLFIVILLTASVSIPLLMYGIVSKRTMPCIIGLLLILSSILILYFPVF